MLACDDALPHLLSDEEVRLAAANMAAKLRPGGMLLASTRDYDRLAQERPEAEGPRVFGSPEDRRIAFQVWDWAVDGRRYRLHQFLVRQAGAGWRADHYATEYRALFRGDLDAALREAGLWRIRWQAPEASGYHQPVVIARAR